MFIYSRCNFARGCACGAGALQDHNGRVYRCCWVRGLVTPISFAFTYSDISGSEYQVPYELTHAHDIPRRFANREVTTGQIVMFRLIWELIPYPASITIVPNCLQFKKVALGATLFLSFSVGLALTVVMSGVLTALSIRYVSKRWSGCGLFEHKKLYFQGILILMVDVDVRCQDLIALI